MTRLWRPLAMLAAVVAVGAAGTLAVGAVVGMEGGELAHLALLLIPAGLATLVSIAVAGPLLARAPVRYRLLAVAIIAAVASVANLSVLAALMIVERADAVLIGVLLLYSTGTGVGAALVLGRSSMASFGHLAATAEALGRGDLSARSSPVEGGEELQTLARTLDEMAERLQHAIDAERAAVESEREAVEGERSAEAARRDLMTAVSHDLRTPLSSLRAMVEAIDDGVVEDLPSLRRYAAEMRRSVDALVQLVDDLFELAKLDAGALQAEAERARLVDVVSSAVEACQAQAGQKGLALGMDLGGVGDTPCSPRLVRVVQNLVQNAIRHTPADGAVRIEARRGPDGLEVAVVDSGEGIAPDALARVFEPFFRADPSRTGTGAGLGLALAKRIVESLGGSIKAESELERGSRFALVVPDGQGEPEPP